MGAQLRGRQLDGGEDWTRELREDCLKISEMIQLPNFLGWFTDFEPKFKQTIRATFNRFSFRLAPGLLIPIKEYDDQWKERIKKDMESLNETLRKSIYLSGAYSHLPPELCSFMDGLSGKLSDYKEFLMPLRVWYMGFDPYLWNPVTSKKFTKGLHDFFYKEHSDLLNNVVPVFEENLGHDWKIRVRGTANRVLEYKRRPADQDGRAPYGNAIDCIKLWRNAQEHYKDYLPQGRKKLSEDEIEERIFQDFHGGYEKIYKSVEILLTSEVNLHKRLQEELLKKLARSFIGSEYNGAGGQSCARLCESTAGRIIRQNRRAGR